MYLSDIRYSWPFKEDAPQYLEDKEIYTHWVEEEDASDVWRINIPPPMDGFTDLAFQYLPTDNNNEEVVFELVHGMTQKPVFRWVKPQNTTKGTWTPFPFPIIHRIIALSEDGIDLLIKHKSPKWGKVEILGQKLDDLPDIKGLSYVFVDNIVNKITMILTPDNVMILPFGDHWSRKTKLLPPLSRVLDTFRAEWCDRAIYWNGVELLRAF